MGLRLVNPAYKSSVQKKAEQRAPAVLAWLQANPEKRTVSIGDLKNGLPDAADDLSRAVVNQIACIIGAGVEGAEDAE